MYESFVVSMANPSLPLLLPLLLLNSPSPPASSIVEYGVPTTIEYGAAIPIPTTDQIQGMADDLGKFYVRYYVGHKGNSLEKEREREREEC
jgi:hypothetical protein